MEGIYIFSFSEVAQTYFLTVFICIFTDKMQTTTEFEQACEYLHPNITWEHSKTKRLPMPNEYWTYSLKMFFFSFNLLAFFDILVLLGSFHSDFAQIVPKIFLNTSSNIRPTPKPPCIHFSKTNRALVRHRFNYIKQCKLRLR